MILLVSYRMTISLKLHRRRVKCCLFRRPLLLLFIFDIPLYIVNIVLRWDHNRELCFILVPVIGLANATWTSTASRSIILRVVFISMLVFE